MLRKFKIVCQNFLNYNFQPLLLYVHKNYAIFSCKANFDFLRAAVFL